MRGTLSLLAHNKWSKIFRGKGATDAARSLQFAKLGKLIQSASRAGGPDPASNMRLASALDAARRASMPKETVERALSAKRDGAALSEGLLEGAGPGSVALLVSVLSDNMRRTVPEVRRLFSKHSGALGAGGSQAFRFTLRGRVCVEAPAAPPPAAWEEALLEHALRAGAEDVEGARAGAGGEPAECVVWCAPTAVGAVRAALGAAGFTVSAAALTREPAALVRPPADAEEALEALISALEAHPDVQEVTTNAGGEEEDAAEE